MVPKPTIGGKVDALTGTCQTEVMTPFAGMSTGRIAPPMAPPMAMTQTGSQVPHLSPTDGRGALGRRGAESHHDMKVV